MRFNELLYPNVDRSRPNRKEFNDYHIKKQMTLFVYKIWDLWFWYWCFNKMKVVRSSLGLSSQLIGLVMIGCFSPYQLFTFFLITSFLSTFGYHRSSGLVFVRFLTHCSNEFQAQSLASFVMFCYFLSFSPSSSPALIKNVDAYQFYKKLHNYNFPTRGLCLNHRLYHTNKSNSSLSCK